MSVVVDDLSGLEPVDRLTGLVGQVARAGGILEYTLHGLYWELVAEGERVDYERKKPGAAALIAWCKEAVLGVSLAEELKTVALEALGEAKAANDRRNDVVHGVWLEPLDETRLRNWQERGVGPVVNEFTAEEILGLVGRIARVEIRLTGLSAIFYWMRQELPGPYPREIYEAMLRGEFYVDGLHSFRMQHDHRPSPPGN